MDILDAIDAVTAPVCGTCTEPLDPAGPSIYFCDDLCSDSWHRTQGEPLVGYRDPWDRPDEFPGVGMDEYSTTPETPSIAFGGRVGFRVAQPSSFHDPAPPRVLVGDGNGGWQDIGTVHRWEATYEDDRGELSPWGYDRLPPTTPAPTLMSYQSTIRVEWPGLEFRLPRATGNLAADWTAARTAEHTATTDAQRAAVRLRIESLTERQRVAADEWMRILAEAFEPMHAYIEAASRAMRQFGESLRPLFNGLRDAGLLDEPESTDPRERALAARRNRGTGPTAHERAPRSMGRPSTSAQR